MVGQTYRHSVEPVVFDNLIRTHAGTCFRLFNNTMTDVTSFQYDAFTTVHTQRQMKVVNFQLGKLNIKYYRWNYQQLLVNYQQRQQQQMKVMVNFPLSKLNVKDEMINNYTRLWQRKKSDLRIHDLPNTARVIYPLSYKNSWGARPLNWVLAFHQNPS